MRRSTPVPPKDMKRLGKLEGKITLGSKVALWKGDITKLGFDAIVNAANKSLLGGGGVDGAIHAAAGRELLQECMKLNGCDTGEAKITQGYRLPAKHVIHTVGPIGENSNLLSCCYKNSLDLMLHSNLKTIAFPCISTGIYGYPNERAAMVALDTTKKWLKKNHRRIDLIVFCIFLQTDLEIYKRLATEYFSSEILCTVGDETQITEPVLGSKNEAKNSETIQVNEGEIIGGSLEYGQDSVIRKDQCTEETQADKEDDQNLKSVAKVSVKEVGKRDKNRKSGELPSQLKSTLTDTISEMSVDESISPEECRVDKDSNSRMNEETSDQGKVHAERDAGSHNDKSARKIVAETRKVQGVIEREASEENYKSSGKCDEESIESLPNDAKVTTDITDAETYEDVQHSRSQLKGDECQKNEQGDSKDSKGCDPSVLSEEVRRRWIKCFERSEIEALEKVVSVDTEPWAAGAGVGYSRLELVGGLDVSYHKENPNLASVSLVVLSFPLMEVVYQDTTFEVVDAPYIPGYLGYREADHFIKKIESARKSNFAPQVVLVDGNGMLHPRKFGSAVQVGVGSDIPTIGVAKNLLVIEELGIRRDTEHAEKIKQLKRKGSTFDIATKNGLVLGKAVRTSDDSTRPVYVSVGHKCSLETAVGVALACSKFRVPEPVRQADHFSKMQVREMREEVSAKESEAAAQCTMDIK